MFLSLIKFDLTNCRDPFWCLLIEVLEAVSVSFMWIVATTYCTVLAPPDIVTTLIGTSVMIHFGVGKGTGTFLGGLLISRFELKHAFRIVGVCAFLLGVIYRISNWIYYKHFSRQQDYEILESDETEKILSRRHSLMEDGLYRRFSVTYESLLME